MKIIVIAGLVAVVASLFSALYYLYHDKGQGTRLVKALALRVALSIALVVFLGRAGRVCGIDGYLAKRWPKSPLW